MKRFMTILSLVLLVSFLSACAGTSDANKLDPAKASSEPKGSAVASDKKVTISYSFWSEAQKPAMEEIARAFEKKHPNITVKIEHTPSAQFWTQLEAGASGGTVPDVFWMSGANFIKYASNGILKPVEEMVKRDKVDLSVYPKSLIDTYKYNNMLYTLPKDFDTVGLFYNKEMFKQKGIPFPDETWDWAKFLDASKKLTDAQNGVWGIAAQKYARVYYNFIYQNGGYVISDDKKTSGFDKPETIEALRFWSDLIHVHKVSPNIAQMTETAPLNMFSSGKIAMYIDGSYQMLRLVQNEYIKDKFDVAVLPKGKKQATTIHGLANVISSKTKHPEEAWEFVKFLGSKEAQEIQGRTGSVIPSYQNMQDLFVKAYPAYNAKAFLDMVPNAVFMPNSKDSANWTNIEDQLFMKVWTGELKVEAASNEVAVKMNDILSKEK
ncbi:MAG: sugar transporter substrate-binding protein [Paenibacillus sp.]|jgi:multiple sugar transport system substrate-binding protein|nr:sugar transporter substrate-binding protein [Paenibacillus sp.]